MPSPDSIVAIGLGGNLGHRAAALAGAVRALSPHLAEVALGGLYESAPIGDPRQPRYLNSALVGRTHLEPEPLLALLKFLERRAGRRRRERWGPRPLDLDLLVHGDLVRDSAELVLPHPGLRRRAFVLVPLADAAPDLRLPPDGATVRSVLEELRASSRDGDPELERREWPPSRP